MSKHIKTEYTLGDDIEPGKVYEVIEQDGNLSTIIDDAGEEIVCLGPDSKGFCAHLGFEGRWEWSND